MPCGHPDDQQTLEDLRLQQVGILGCWGDGRLFFLTWWGLNVAFFFWGVKFAKDQRFGGGGEELFSYGTFTNLVSIGLQRSGGGGGFYLRKWAFRTQDLSGVQRPRVLE